MRVYNETLQNNNHIGLFSFSKNGQVFIKKSSETINYVALFWGIIGVILVIILLYYLVPIIYSACPKIFITSMYGYKNEKFNNIFNDLEIFDLSPKTSRSFFIKSFTDEVLLGIWQILPHETDVSGEDLSDEQFEKKLNDGIPIFIYFHGVNSNRAVDYRVAVYKLISKLGYHVLTLDYRGFGDSEGVPESENDVVSDALSLVKYVRVHAPNSTLILWGHSMGSGVTGSVYKALQDDGEEDLVQGILIDGGFNKFSSAIHRHRYIKAYKAVIGIYKMLNHMLHATNIEYDSVENLRMATVPISIVHSEDDDTVPFILGKRLYEGLIKTDRDVTFTNLGRKEYCHCYNYKSPELPAIINELVKTAETQNCHNLFTSKN